MPRYFIKWVQRILKDWDTPEIQREVKDFGLRAQTLGRPLFQLLPFILDLVYIYVVCMVPSLARAPPPPMVWSPLAKGPRD